MVTKLPTQAEVDLIFKNLGDSTRRYNSANVKQDGKALAHFGVAVEKHLAELKDACTTLIAWLRENHPETRKRWTFKNAIRCGMTKAPTQAVIDRVAELEAVLIELEWAGDRETKICPWCGGNFFCGHSDDCTLAALLSEEVADETV